MPRPMPRYVSRVFTTLPKSVPFIRPSRTHSLDLSRHQRLFSESQTRFCAPQLAGVETQTKSSSTSLSLQKVLQKPPPTHPTAHPLSSLPTTALLRSLLITTISSHPLLLKPALQTLSFLVRSRSNFIFNVDRNPILYTILRKTFYDQFCAGETAEETRACVKGLKAVGFRGVILTYAKETVFDHLTKSLHGYHGRIGGQLAAATHDSDIEDWRVGVLKTASMIEAGDYLAIKLTGAGPIVTCALADHTTQPQQMLEALDEIATTCKDRGVKIIIDAESTRFQKAIDTMAVDLMRKYNREGSAAIYNTYQAYLKSTSSNVANHVSQAHRDGFTLGLKLVRGAYIFSDDRTLIHDTKDDTDRAYDSIIQGAIRRQLGVHGGTGPSSLPFPSVDLFLASHNKNSLLSALRLRRQMIRAGEPTVPVAFGQLHGMSDDLSFSLLHEGQEDEMKPDVFKCSTWGTMGECLAYLMRRATENRDAVLRTMDEHTAVKRECWRRLKLVFSAGV